MIKGKFIKNKQPETIINGIVTSWVIGDGISPGQPTEVSGMITAVSF